jgi:hypothetical protein
MGPRAALRQRRPRFVLGDPGRRRRREPADDGYRGVAFVEAAIASSDAGGAWTAVG